MKIHYHPHASIPWNRAFEHLLLSPQKLEAYVDVTNPENLPSDLTAWTKTMAPRDQVVSILEKHQAGPSSSLNALKKEECLVVTTGQQPALGGGPLYLLYKIFTAIRLAEKLSEERQVPVIPLYCCGSDDHDWSEANRFFSWNEGKWQRRHLSEEPEGAHLYEKNYPELDLCRQALGFENNESLDGFVFPNRSFSFNQLELIKKTFESSALVVFEPHWFRELATEFNSQIFQFREAIDQDLLMAGSALKLGRLPETFQGRQGTQLCFNHQGRRERLRQLENGSWGGRHASLGDTEEVQRLLKEEPDMWSPNVVSRPVWMRGLFPVVADIVGPSEAAYQLQLQGIFRRFNLAAPVLVPRVTATILRSREVKKLKALGKEPWELEGQWETSLDESLKEATSDRLQGIENLLGTLKNSLSEAYPELEGKFLKLSERILRDVHKIPAMLERAENIREGDQQGQWESLKAWCLPEGKHQERVASLLSMNEAIGFSWWEEFQKSVDPLKRQPVWVMLDKEGDYGN